MTCMMTTSNYIALDKHGWKRVIGGEISRSVMFSENTTDISEIIRQIVNNALMTAKFVVEP